MAKLGPSEGHERELFDKNLCLKHHLLVDKVEEECDEAQGVKSKNAITNAKVELANEKENLRLLKSRRL